MSFISTEKVCENCRKMGMRNVNVTKILVGLLLGFGGRLFYQNFVGLRKLETNSLHSSCPPCQGSKRILGQACPLCGPENVIAQKDPDVAEAYKPKGMYEVTRWYNFDENYMYDIFNGEPKIKLVGGWYEETKGIMQVALEYINTNKMLGKTWDLVGLQNGYLRTDAFRGTDYILDLAVKSVEKHESESIKTGFRINMVHAFEPKGQSLKILSHRDDPKVGIHIIVPVSGSESALDAFIELYNKKRSNLDKLTLALFQGKGRYGEESITMKDKVEEHIKKSPSAGIDYIEVEGDYNFLQAVKQATMKANPNDIVLTLNIDMHFGHDLLQTCRLIALPNERVYFPIAFGQYDPEIIEKGMPPGKPRKIDKMNIHRFTGYWMNNNHNFICTYSKDLQPILEKVLFSMASNPEAASSMDNGETVFNSFSTNDIEVISSVEPDLIQIFRKRRCDKRFMRNDEYNQCFDTAVEMLGSKPTVTILYLTEIAQKKV